MISCCRYCTPETGRHAGCHAQCQTYLQERENHIAQQKAINKEKYKDRQIKGYFADDKERRRRLGFTCW